MEFNVNPQYSVKSIISPVLSHKKIRSIREDTSKSLRESLASNKDVQVARKYFISLPTAQAR